MTVEALVGQQLTVIALLNDFSVLHNQDHIGGFDGGKTVGNDERGAPLHHSGKGVLDLQFHTGINGGGGLVQDQHGGKIQHNAGDAKELLLPLGKVTAVFSQHGIVALWKALDKGMGVSRLGRRDHFLLGSIGLGHTDVFPHGGGAEPGVLENHAPVGSQAGTGNVAHVGAVYKDRAAVNFVESGQQVDHGGLARAGCTDDGDLFVANRRSSEVNPTANAAVNISATLRKPLHSMMNAATELFNATESQNDARLSSASSRLNQSIYQFLRLCGQMSDGGRLLLQRKQLHREPTDLNAFFADFIAQAKPLVESLGVSLHFEPLSTSLRGDVDKDLLERSLYNLLSNALSYTHKGGNITISLQKLQRMLFVSVKDDGEGISPEVLSTLFERFTDHSIGDSRWGIGFGLPMAREICQLHGGDLSVAPNPDGKGTCVTFTLSLEPAPLQMRSPGLRYDYSAGLNHALVELSDVLSSELFDPKEI